jgi:hypothetical protein
MTLRRFALVQTPAARAGAGLALLALIGVGIATANTEAVVAGRFTAALESAPRQVVADRSVDRTLISGSEAYWLAEKRRHDSAGAALEPAAWSAAPFAANIAVGDRITISGAKGDRVLEVVTIADVEPASEAAGHARALRKIVVTCRDLSTPDKRLVTFEIPVETPPGALKSARAL